MNDQLAFVASPLLGMAIFFLVTCFVLVFESVYASRFTRTRNEVTASPSAVARLLPLYVLVSITPCYLSDKLSQPSLRAVVNMFVLLASLMFIRKSLIVIRAAHLEARKV